MWLLGHCYPCVLSVSVSCTCGATSISVPCGRERTTKPPRCTKLCQLPSTCHHSTPHRCHTGKCPPCKQVCSLSLPCGHSCSAQCHSRPTPLLPVGGSEWIVVVFQHCFLQAKPVAPWKKKVEPAVVVKQCPLCLKPVLRPCYGGHCMQEMPCSQVTGYSCGQLCGRELQCGNHTCRRNCHTVMNAQGLNSVRIRINIRISLALCLCTLGWGRLLHMRTALSEAAAPRLCASVSSPLSPRWVDNNAMPWWL